MTYDSVADAAYVYLVEQIATGEAVKTHVTDVPLDAGTVLVNLDKDGRLLGFEILGARGVLRDETLATAEDIT